MHVPKTTPLEAEVSFAPGTVNRGSQTALSRPHLKYRFFFFLVAVSTKPMRWTGTLWVTIERIRENAGSKFFKGVLGCIGFPIFHINQLLFKSIIFIQQFLILRLDAHNRRLERDYRRL